MKLSGHIISLLVAGLTLSIAGAMYYSFYSGRNIAIHHAPLVDAAMEIRLEATTAHLWFEEAISGDRTLDIAVVWEHLDQAQWYAQAMLDGGINNEGTFIALDDADLRKQIEKTSQGIRAFRSIAQQRWNQQSHSGIGSDIDQRFDKVFQELINSADNVEIALQKMIQKDLQKYNTEQILLIIIILLLGIFIGILLYRYDRRRSKYMIELHEKKENLRITLNSIGDAVIVTDSNGNVTHLNPVAEQLTGWSHQDAQMKPLVEVFNIVHAHTLKPAVNPVKQVLETGVIVGLANHTMLISKDGTEYQIADSGAPIRSQSDLITGVVLVFRDVTQEYALQESLQSSQSFLSTLLHSVPDLIWLKDVEGVYLACNQKFEQFFGASESEIIGKTDYDFVDKELADSFRENDQIALNAAGKASVNEETITFASDGHTEQVETIKIAMSTDDDELIGILGIARDITQRKTTQEKLELSARIIDSTHEGITITDANQIIIDVNPAFCTITGYSREDVIGQTPSILSSGMQSSEFYADMWREINEKGHWQGEVWNRKKNGEIYAELLTVSTLKDTSEKVMYYVGTFTDITHSKAQQEKLNMMAHYDVLTGLPNRVLFTDRFHQAIAHSKRSNTELAICFLDLDNFKPINDYFGHSIGDQILIEVASRIISNIREEDTVSRQGGDEFAILLGNIENYSQCELTLERIHQSLAQPYLIDGYAHKITASSGITIYPEDNADIDTLLRHADQSMYQAKLAGKHRYQRFNPLHDEQITQKHHQLSEIQQALSNNEFCLYYQPKVNMMTGDVFGVEALIRWNHPEKGLVAPLDFLPIVESTELDLQIGDWVINQALEQLDTWYQQGIKLEVSVNISSYHLLSSSFLDKFNNALSKHPKIDSKLLQLEILESSALYDLNTITSVIKSCQDTLGLTIALDDFGTGYSSLTHLRNLPVNTIKIDQSFIRDMLDDPSDSTIIDGVIGLSKSFNRNVIAEGVETTAHGLMLLIMGCVQAQGYGIAKPMPAKNIQSWLNDYSPNKDWQRYAAKNHTKKENKLKLYRLISSQWMDVFISNIQSPETDIKAWPILNSQLCHCGIWIIYAKQDQLFESEWLDRLDDSHEEVHAIASKLLVKYQEGDIEEARSGLENLHAAYDNMRTMIDLYE